MLSFLLLLPVPGKVFSMVLRSCSRVFFGGLEMVEVSDFLLFLGWQQASFGVEYYSH